MTSPWDSANYERAAETIAPAAAMVAGALAPELGERVLDVACGTGNATYEIAAFGAQVTGVDLAERLLGVARTRVPEAEFVHGDATALPFDDDIFDAAVSVFGVIFATPSERAAAEMLRVVRPGGRIVLSAWQPWGPIVEFGNPLREALGPPPGEPPAKWNEPDVVASLFDGRTPAVQQHDIAFTGASPRAVADEFYDRHPMWVNAREKLGDARYEELRAEGAEILERVNEDPSAGFKGTSQYLVYTITV